MDPGIVGCDSHWDIAIIDHEQMPELPGSAADVLDRIIGIDHAEVSRRRRHQLHQPHGAFARDRFRSEIRFGLDDRPQQCRFKSIPLGIEADRSTNLLLRISWPVISVRIGYGRGQQDQSETDQGTPEGEPDPSQCWLAVNGDWLRDDRSSFSTRVSHQRRTTSMPYTSSPTTRRTTVPSFLTGVCFTVCVQTCELAAVFELRKKKRDERQAGYRPAFTEDRRSAITRVGHPKPLQVASRGHSCTCKTYTGSDSFCRNPGGTLLPEKIRTP